MGYYSNVAIHCEEKAFGMIMESIKNHNEKNRPAGFADFKPDSIKVKVRNGKKEYLLFWESVKWYSDFGDIKAVEDVLKKLNKAKEDDIDGYRYDFLRLGEEFGDKEEQSNDYCFGEIFAESYISTGEGFKEVEND